MNSGPLEQPMIVLPARVADTDPPARGGLGKEVGGEDGAARPTDRPHIRDPALSERRMFCPEHEALDAGAVARIALDRKMRSRSGLRPFPACAHRLEHRAAAHLVSVWTTMPRSTVPGRSSPW